MLILLSSLGYVMLFISPMIGVGLLTCGYIRRFLRYRKPLMSLTHIQIWGLGVFLLSGILVSMVHFRNFSESPSAQLASEMHQLAEETKASRPVAPAPMRGGAGRAFTLAGPEVVQSISAWNAHDGSNGLALYQGDGYWKLQRFGQNGEINTHFNLSSEYSLTAEEPVTLSFLFRSDGTNGASFSVDFLTNRGSNMIVPARMQYDGYELATATYYPKQADRVLRKTIALTQFTGDWTWLEIGQLHLERGSHAHTPMPTRPSLSSSIMRTLGWWFGLGLLLFILIESHGAALEELGSDGVRYAILGGLVLSAALGLVVNIFPVSDLIGLVMPSSRGGRYQGWAVHPNILGHQAAVVAAIFVLTGSGWQRYLSMGASGLLIGLSKSYAALGSYALAIVFVGLRMVSRVTPRLFWLVGLCLIGATVSAAKIFGPPSLSAAESSLTIRLQGWNIAFNAVSAHPIAGVGQHGFTDFIQIAKQNMGLDQAIDHAHNVLLDMGVQYGLLGIFALSVLLIIIFWPLRQRPADAGLFLCIMAPMFLFDATLFSAGIFPLVVLFPMLTSSIQGSASSD